MLQLVDWNQLPPTPTNETLDSSRSARPSFESALLHARHYAQHRRSARFVVTLGIHCVSPFYLKSPRPIPLQAFSFSYFLPVEQPLSQLPITMFFSALIAFALLSSLSAIGVQSAAVVGDLLFYQEILLLMTIFSLVPNRQHPKRVRVPAEQANAPLSSPLLQKIKGCATTSVASSRWCSRTQRTNALGSSKSLVSGTSEFHSPVFRLAGMLIAKSGTVLLSNSSTSIRTNSHRASRA